MVPPAFAALLAVVAAPAPRLVPTEHAMAPTELRQHRLSDAIFALSEDRDGFLWIGSGSGACRYDGLSCRWLDAPAPRELVGALHSSNDGSLWVGYHEGAGLHRLREGRLERIGGPGGTVVTAFAFAEEGGRLWVGAPTGLYQVDGSALVPFAGSLPSQHVRALAPAEGGGLWVGTTAGLARVRGTEARLLGERMSIVNVATFRGRTLVLADGHGMLAVEGEALVPFAAAAVPTNGSLRSLLAADDSLWFGGDFSPLRRLGPGGSELLVFPGFPGARVESLAVDRHGSVWVGTQGDALFQITTRPPFEVWGRERGMPGHAVFSVLAASDGTTWFVLGTALARLRDGRIEPVVVPAEWKAFDFRGLAEGIDGSVWIGSLESGLYRFTGGTLTRFARGDELAGKGPATLHRGRDGTIWVGFGEGGLGAVATNGRVSFVPPTALGCDRPVLAIADAPDGTVWAATEGSGLCRRSPDGKTQAFRASATGLPSNRLRSLHIDDDGRLWIGTFDAGLVTFDGAGFGRVGRRERLGTDHVVSILSDAQDHLWLGSPNGIHRVSRRALLDRAAGKDRWVDGLHFGRDDGLPSDICVGSFQATASRAPDGTLWFATLRGAAAIPNPEALRPPDVGNVVVDDVLVDGASVGFRGGVDVPAGRGRLEIHYDAGLPAAAHRLRFRYRLEGFDADWVEGQTRRVAYYTNVPPGRYGFAVEAWSEGSGKRVARTLAIVLAPPFHRTRTFYALVALALILTVLGIVRARKRQARARREAVEDERTRIARDMHDTLEQGLVGVRLQLEAAERSLAVSGADTRGFLLRARELVAQTMREAKTSIWALRSGIAGAPDLPTALSAAAGRVLGGTELRFSLDVEGDPYRLEPEAEQQLLRVVQEGITNALKHADARAMRIRVRFGAEALLVRLEDDGRGFSAAGAGAPAAGGPTGGFGLVGMRERVAHLGGRLSIESKPGEGTIIDVEVPARRRGAVHARA